MNNQQNPEEQLSAEELVQRKEEMKKFYDESVPYLESQAKYEKLLTDIEEARFKRATFQYQFAMMMQGAEEAEKNNQVDGDPIAEKRVNPETAGKRLKKN